MFSLFEPVGLMPGTELLFFLVCSSWKEITIPRLFKGEIIPDQSVPCSDITEGSLAYIGVG